MRKTKGFTLIEMLVVIAIIMILMSLLAVFIGSLTDRARYAKTRAIVDMLDKGCASYKVDFGIYPPNNKNDSRCFHLYLGRERLIQTQFTDEGQSPVRRKPPIIEFKLDMLQYTGSGPVDPDRNPLPIIDPWENLIRYENPGQINSQGIDIWSPGKNGKDEKDPADANFDDVTNWQKDY